MTTDTPVNRDAQAIRSCGAATQLALSQAAYRSVRSVTSLSR